MFYRHGLWRRGDRLGLGYSAPYPYAHGFVRGPWYSSLRHGLGHHPLWHGLHFGQVPGNYVFRRAYRHGSSYGYGHGYQGYGHFTGEFIMIYEWGLEPINRIFCVLFSGLTHFCIIP